jgi:hypothetical protein
VTSLPTPEEAARLTSFLHDHQRWSAFWDKRHGVWRVAEVALATPRPVPGAPGAGAALLEIPPREPWLD